MSGLLPALLCLTPIIILISAALMGVSIRRTGEESLKPSEFQRGLTLLSYAFVTLTASAAYVTLTGEMAVRRGRSTTNPVIRLLTGGRRLREPLRIQDRAEGRQTWNVEHPAEGKRLEWGESRRPDGHIRVQTGRAAGMWLRVSNNLRHGVVQQVTNRP